MTVEGLRSDARRNRELLIASARRLFAEKGLDIPVEDITQSASLGMGTLYRHFPTKEDLIAAVLEDAFEDYIALADSALEEEESRAGLERFLERALEAYAENRGLASVAAGHQQGRRIAAFRRRLKSRLRTLADRADVEADDVLLVLQGGAGVIERSPDSWRRYLGIALDGLGTRRP